MIIGAKSKLDYNKRLITTINVNYTHTTMLINALKQKLATKPKQLKNLYEIRYKLIDYNPAHTQAKTHLTTNQRDKV